MVAGRVLYLISINLQIRNICAESAMLFFLWTNWVRLIKKIWYVYIAGLCYLMSTAVMMTITFLAAYLNPDKSINVTINSYGEANFELGLILLGSIAATILFIQLIRDIKMQIDK